MSFLVTGRGERGVVLALLMMVREEGCDPRLTSAAAVAPDVFRLLSAASQPGVASELNEKI